MMGAAHCRQCLWDLSWIRKQAEQAIENKSVFYAEHYVQRKLERASFILLVTVHHEGKPEQKIKQESGGRNCSGGREGVLLTGLLCKRSRESG